MALDSMKMSTDACLVSEEMAQYYLTVDGQPGTYILGDTCRFICAGPACGP